MTVSSHADQDPHPLVNGTHGVDVKFAVGHGLYEIISPDALKTDPLISPVLVIGAGRSLVLITLDRKRAPSWHRAKESC